MSPKGVISTTVDAWRRLWSVGANGENICSNNNQTSNTTTTTNKRTNHNKNNTNNKHKTTNKHDRNTQEDSNDIPTTTRRQKRDRHQHKNTSLTNSSLHQTNLRGESQELLDVEEYGDIMRRRPDNTLRLMLHNINRLPIDARSTKSKKLISTLTNKQIDIVMMTEVGLHWKIVDKANRWYERVRTSFKTSKTELAYNTTEPERTAQVQFGGVGVMAIEDCAHRIVKQGQDKSGLGRWGWMRLEGRQGHHLVVAAVYRPVDSVGPGTVYSQHERYFASQFRDAEPRAALYADLAKEVKQWLEDGDQVIIGIDANEDVRHGATRETFQQLGMREIILKTHGHRSPPATCDKNHNREPIDGIFVTPGIRISAGGYAPFNHGCPSDHRYLWIDVPFQDAFGYSSPPLVSPQIRRLNTKNPIMVQQYNTQLRVALKNAGLLDALTTLAKTAETSTGWSTALEQEYNRINDRQYEIRRDIEQKIRHLRTGGVPWSPHLQKYRTEIEIWTMLLKKRKGRKISNRKLRRLLQKTDIKDAYEKTIPQLEDECSDAFERYKKAREEALPWREEFLGSLAEARAKTKGTTKAKELTQLLTIEKQRTVARNVKRMQGKLQRNATTQIYVTDEQGRRAITDKTEIEDACIAENVSRFSQSNDTPPMTTPLLQDLGYLGDTPQAQEILDGTYSIPPDTDPYAALLLHALRMPDNVKDQPMATTTVTPQRNKQAWSKQREDTSAEPSGLTFSHYKAAALDDDINLFDSQLRNLPYSHGFSPTHWQHITDVEILKKAGVYDIEKMRTITLMDAAYNTNNKQLGKDMMEHAERLDNLAREQYGSRKHHQSATAAANKVLTMDLLRLRRQAGALCSNDAKSCYDRVVHSIAALAMRRLGAPLAAILSMLITLQQAQHRIRTGYGVSRKWFGRLLIPLMGLGQGNGVAPAAWAAISTVIIGMMRSAGFGLNISSCLSATLLCFLCYAFVDDTDLVHTGKNVNVSGEEVLQDMRRFVTHWEGGLRATGGALRVDKSFWYLLDFEWKNDRWSYRTKASMPGDITVRDADGTMKVVPRLEPHEAIETLGVYVAMDGNFDEEIDKLRQKAEEFAEQVRTGFVDRDEAWHALNTTIMKTFEYPMTAISLTKSQWDHIMAPILKVVLPKSGIVRTFPRDILYAPGDLSGMGLIHPFYRQYFKHLELVLKENLKPSITANLLDATLEQLRLESGLPGTNGEWRMTEIGHYLTSCWIKDLLQFCDDHSISLVDNCPTIPLLTTDDLYLMEAFLTRGFEGHELRVLNECRMFLEVITLSDLCTADGQFITYASFHGQKSHRPRRAGWPRHPPRLSASHWRQWQSALLRCFIIPHNPHRRLRRSVGTWLPSALPHWEWFYSTGEMRLYHLQDGIYHLYSRNNTRAARTSTFHRIPETTTLLPPNARLATTSILPSGHYQLTGTATIPPPLPPPDVYHDMALIDIIDSLPENDSWAIEGLHCNDDGRTMAEAIIRGKATAVSDGSYKNSIGTSGFILRGLNRVIGAAGVNTVPGNSEEQSSYRSELAGISGVLLLVDIICKKHDITAGSIELALDGEQALKRASSQWPLSPTDADFDLLTDIRRKLLKLPVSVTWTWIEGHQDDHLPFHMLPPLAQDNVMADGLAKNHLNTLGCAGFTPSPLRFGDEGWSVMIDDNKLSNLDFQKFYANVWADRAMNYWTKKHNIPFQKILSIDWQACGETIASLQFAKRRRLVKHATGHFGNGVKMQLWGFQERDECPLCTARETPSHILLCRDPRAQTVWETSLKNLDTWMVTSRTHPAIRQSILLHLRAWHDGQSHMQPYPSSPCFAALRDQHGIGWYPFLLGHISNHWRSVQQDYYQWLGRRNTGRRWVKKLIAHLFDVSWDMWEHRNGIKHNTPTAAKLRELDRVNGQITEQYSEGTNHLLPRDHRWFSKPLQTVLTEYTIIDKEQWLASVVNARYKWIHRRDTLRASVSASRQLMRNWLVRPTRPHASKD